MNLGIKDFLEKLPEQWKQPIIIFVAIAFCVQFLLFLLKQFRDLLPTKTSKKSKEELLSDYLKKNDYLDKRIFEHFKDLQDAELFYQVTRIKCKKDLRDGLIWFYHNTSSKFSWEFIKPAIPYLYECNWELFVRIPKLEIMYMISSFVSGAIFFALSLVILFLILVFASKLHVNVFISMCMFSILLTMMGFLLFIPTIPTIRAWMISREINRIKNTSINSESKNKKHNKHIGGIVVLFSSFTRRLKIFKR
jgi:ABC-type multidrug transport system fused ATPase/permease subunit